MSRKFIAAVQTLRPGVNFANSDDTLAGIRWDTPDVVPPTQVEVDAAMAIFDYRTKRAAAYPSLADLADAIVKEPTDGGAALNAYRAACLDVKTRYPKPKLTGV